MKKDISEKKKNLKYHKVTTSNIGVVETPHDIKGFRFRAEST